MANGNLNRLINERKEAQKRMKSALAAAADRARVQPEQAIAELDRMIAHQRDRLEATKAAMEASAKRFQEEIRLREQRIVELEALATRQQKGDEQLREPTKPGMPGITGRLDLREVEGVGPVAARKLGAAGINTVKKLGKASEARVQEVLDVTRDKAESVIAAAKRMLDRG